MFSALVPLWMFMLLPIWIPMIAVGLGMANDRLRALRGRHAEPSIHERLATRRAAEGHAAVALQSA